MKSAVWTNFLFTISFFIGFYVIYFVFYFFLGLDSIHLSELRIFIVIVSFLTCPIFVFIKNKWIIILYYLLSLYLSQLLTYLYLYFHESINLSKLFEIDCFTFLLYIFVTFCPIFIGAICVKISKRILNYSKRKDF